MEGAKEFPGDADRGYEEVEGVHDDEKRVLVVSPSWAGFRRKREG